MYTIGTVKHGVGKCLMVWEHFSGFSVLGLHYLMEGIMDNCIYNPILENQMIPFVNDNMPLKWTLQQDNDPKHTSKLIKAWFDKNKITVMHWPTQSPDLNPIENLWKQLDDKLRLRGRFRNAEELIRNFRLPGHK